MKNYFVYILTNSFNTVLYIGLTSNLLKRISEHREKLVDGFTKEYNVWKLVYYEIHTDITLAITREKRLKKWNRSWKEELISRGNPEWKDLFKNLK